MLAVFLMIFIPLTTINFLIIIIIGLSGSRESGLAELFQKATIDSMNHSSFLLSVMFFFSCVITWLIFNARFEYPAMKSLGIGKKFFMKPVLIFALMLSILNFINKSFDPQQEQKGEPAHLNAYWNYNNGHLIYQPLASPNETKKEFFLIELKDNQIESMLLLNNELSSTWKRINDTSLSQNQTWEFFSLNDVTSYIEDLIESKPDKISADIDMEKKSTGYQLIDIFNMTNLLVFSKIFSVFALFAFISLFMADAPPRKYDNIKSIVVVTVISILFLLFENLEDFITFEGQWSRISSLIGVFYLSLILLIFLFRRYYYNFINVFKQDTIEEHPNQ